MIIQNVFNNNSLLFNYKENRFPQIKFGLTLLQQPKQKQSAIIKLQSLITQSHNTMNQTRYLIQELSNTDVNNSCTTRMRERSSSRQSRSSRKSQHQLSPQNRSPTKLSKQLVYAKARYQHLTNMTKQEQSRIVRRDKSKKKQDWSHDYYMGSGNFSLLQNKYLNQFPHNNVKYNVQFLQRSLQGTNLKFPRRDSGQFKKPSQKLYSSHYKPILKQKVSFNEDWQLRASLFGKTWVDQKRDKIMDKYTIQANPFKTQRSNQILSKLRSSYQYNK